MRVKLLKFENNVAYDCSYCENATLYAFIGASLEWYEVTQEQYEYLKSFTKIHREYRLVLDCGDSILDNIEEVIRQQIEQEKKIIEDKRKEEELKKKKAKEKEKNSLAKKKAMLAKLKKELGG